MPPTGPTTTLAAAFSITRNAVRTHALRNERSVTRATTPPEEEDLAITIWLAVAFKSGTKLVLPDGRRWEIQQVVLPGTLKFSRVCLSKKQGFLYRRKPAANVSGSIFDREVQVTFADASSPVVSIEDAALGPIGEDCCQDFDVYYREDKPSAVWMKCTHESTSSG